MTLFIIRRKNLQIKHRELDHHLITLELKALQSMMNPHFIFNALGSIQNFLFQNKNDEAGLYLSKFARLIRQNMNALNATMINLDEEVDRLKNYLDLERLRMENKFDYRIEYDEHFDPEEIHIPSMIIQPFVENSIWHGISTRDGNGFIHITFSHQEDKSLRVVVEDNGIGINKAQSMQTKDDKHLKLGMEMTRKRLELLGRKYNVETRIEFSDINPGDQNPGTRVVLVIPVSLSKT
jgi:LytS/YehU family sensor histidine kinase